MWVVSLKSEVSREGARGGRCGGAQEGSMGNAYVLLALGSKYTWPRSISETPHPAPALHLDPPLTTHTAVPGYPALIPFRDPHTWCRMMQHVVVSMSSDAPEFLEALVELNTAVLAEAVQCGIISAETRASRAEELEVVVEQILAARKAEITERLRRLYLERNGESVERKGSSQESRCGETLETEFGAALESECGETLEEVSV